MSIPSFTEAILRQHVSDKSFRRGKDYYHQGAVTALILRSNELQADVEGNEYEPYQVRVHFDAGGITSAECSCPYDWGGWCKHIVATLLMCLDQPETVQERPALAEVLNSLERDQLQDLLLKLAARDPGLAAAIDHELSLRQTAAAPSKTASRRTAIDPQPVQQQVHSILHSPDRMRSSAGYRQVGSVVDEVSSLLESSADVHC